MIHDTTVRRVHEWAIGQVDQVQSYQVAEALSIANTTANNALTALVAAGFATRRRPPRDTSKWPQTATAYDYFVTGTKEQVAARFSGGLVKVPPPPPLYARASSVFEYGDRCLAEAEAA